MDPANPALAQRRLLEKNISLSMAQKAIEGGLSLPIPTIALLWQSGGMGLAEFMWLQSIFAVAIVIFEVPSGYFADICGRRRSLVASTALLTSGAILYYSAFGFLQFLIAEALYALGFAFLSGADQALLYDSLKALGRERESGELWGRARFRSMLSMSLCTIVGGFAGAEDPRLPFLLESFMGVTALFLVMGMWEPPREASAAKVQPFEIASLARMSFADTRIRWLMVFPALLLAGNTAALWMYQPYFVLTGVPVWWFGVIFAAFNGVSAVASKSASRIAESVGAAASLVLPLLALVLSFVLLSSITGRFSFLFMLLQQWVRGYQGVVFSDRLNNLIPSRRRATLLSLQSFLARAAEALLLLLQGFILKEVGITAGMQVLAAIIAVLGMAMLVPAIRASASAIGRADAPGRLVPKALGAKAAPIRVSADVQERTLAKKAGP